MIKNTASAKHDLRQECKSIRSALEEDFRQQASQAICRQIENWGPFHRSTVISTYLPMGSEVDIKPLLARLGHKHWAIPLIHPGGRMTFHTYDSAKLVLHPYGMLEPDPACPLVPPQEVHLALVPGLAFDPNGWRLGYGGGFYDRFLSHFEGLSAGITFEALLRAQIPHAGHDIPMQFIITETGVKPTGN